MINIIKTVEAEVVAIEHQLEETKKMLIVDWSLGNTCNYTCSYCPPDTHSGTHPFVEKEDILSFTEKVLSHYRDELGQEICFLYTGGEVTIFDDFMDLIKIQKESGNSIGISTNGSRPVRYWEQAREYLDHISISYHSDHTNVDHFIRVINCIKNHSLTHVNIMMKPEACDECINIAYRVLEETDEVTIDLQIVLENFQKPYEYTDEQTENILKAGADINSKLKLKRERKPYRGLMRLQYSNGTNELIKPGVILTNNMNAWKGWECNVGVEQLVIDMHGNVKRSWCGHTGVVGNVRDEKIDFPKASYTCPVERCTGGITDIMTTKVRPKPIENYELEVEAEF